MAQKPKRLMSLDAFRGFVMLAMASSGFAFKQVAKVVRDNYAGTSWENGWRFLWDTLAYQFDHVAWTGCAAWDLIQPCFMFMVGVALPFSVSRRVDEGENPLRRLAHAAYRSAVLVALGVLLSSSLEDGINFTFANVLAQIGLGYLFVFLLADRSLKVLVLAATVVLGGYGAWFVYQPLDPAEIAATQHYISSELKLPPSEWSQFQGHEAHWNKHTNAAASFDRQWLSKLPRKEQPWFGRTFWVNKGGYQTLNFVPSMATMIFGLMAGRVLRSERDDKQRLKWLFGAGLFCFVLSLGADRNLWPIQWLSPEWQQKIWEHSWSLCPAVKRIWTPTWAVFSAGWAFWVLAAFYWVVDVKGYQKIVMPLAVVGINSIAMYCLYQLFRGWIGGAIRVSFNTIDRLVSWENGLGSWIDPNRWAYAPICDNALRLAVLWGVCFWMYRKRLFVRI